MTKKEITVNIGLDVGTSNTKVVICENNNLGDMGRISHIVDFNKFGHHQYTANNSEEGDFKDCHLIDVDGHEYNPFIKTHIDYDSKKGYYLHEQMENEKGTCPDLKLQFMVFITGLFKEYKDEKDIDKYFKSKETELTGSSEYKNLKAFISCVIVYSAQWFIKDIKKLKTDFVAYWNTYMGIPNSMTFFDDIVSRKLEYKAYELLLKESCEEAFKILGKNHEQKQNLVLPELTAVTFTTATTQNMNDELFCGVDIGDGTMDVLVSKLTKTTDENGTPQTEFKCFAGRVYPGSGGRGYQEAAAKTAADKLVFKKKIIDEISSVLKKAYEIPEYNMSWDIGMKIMFVGGGSEYPDYKYALYQVDHDVLYPESRTDVLKPTSYSGISFLKLNILNETFAPINLLNDNDSKESSFKEYLVKRFAVAKGLACVSSIKYNYGERYMTSNF